MARLQLLTNLTILNGTLYFDVYNAIKNKSEFWKSDGTAAGCVLLKDSLSAYNYLALNNSLYFNGNGELWKSDGTSIGTVDVKDINPGYNFSNPFYFTIVNNKIFFSASDGIHGIELWQSDGTQGGTFMVKDINQTTTSSSYPWNSIAYGDHIIFTAQKGNGDPYYSRVWKTDGSEAGTSLLLNDSLIYGSGIKAPANDEFYFMGSTTISGKQGLYKLNGISGTPILIKDFSGENVDVQMLKAANNLAYFYVYHRDLTYTEIWRTDGTEANTFAIKDDITDNTYYLNLTPVNDIIYFTSGGALWKSDGTIAGTTVLKYFNSTLENLTANNGKLFFTTYDGINTTIWKSDGTPDGTIKITNNVTNTTNLTSVNGELFFAGYGNSNIYGDVGTELFRTDGTENGTILVKDITAGNLNSNIYDPIAINNSLYFFIYNYPDSVSLWKSDGTSQGTILIKNVSKSSIPRKIVECNSQILFVVDGKLWQSNGTTLGTHPVIDNIFPEIILDDYNTNLTAAGNQIFFNGSSYKYGTELYAGIIESGGPLPVTLLDFKGKLKNYDGLLEWSTAHELNNSHFNLLRSTNAINFKNIAKVNAADNPVIKNDYSYLDLNITKLNTNKIFYRLEQVDKNGKSTLSNIVVIDVDKSESQFTLAPNPVKNSINIYATENIDNAIVSLRDINGVVLSIQKTNIKAGQPVYFPAYSLSKGMYIITIESPGVYKQLKMVKQ